jgi:4-carboxymuconolactone decarboxylase
MMRLTATVAAASLFITAPVSAQSLNISRGGSRPVRPAPPQNFTGHVQVEMLFEAPDPSHASAGTVTFEPGARTAWHTHPRGQMLIVTAGVGRVQVWGEPVHEIRAGDVVTIPADRKHWHGASSQSAMTHIAITEHRQGTRVQWMELVSDEQYNATPASAGRAPAPPAPQAISAPQRQSSATSLAAGRPSGPLQQKVAPGMAALTDEVLYGDVWRRAELSPRDRSLLTITLLIATGKTAPLAGHLGRALDNGVTPMEASGLLAHLAIYCGWPSAVAALEAYDQVYTARKIDTEALRAVGARSSTPVGNAARANAVGDAVGAIAPKFVQLTNEVVFGDLWRRPDLGVRDRHLVTVAVLAATGDADQLIDHLRRGVDSGLTRDQIVEAITHLAFYAGWNKATKAMTLVARTLGE